MSNNIRNVKFHRFGGKKQENLEDFVSREKKKTLEILGILKKNSDDDNRFPW